MRTRSHKNDLVEENKTPEFAIGPTVDVTESEIPAVPSNLVLTLASSETPDSRIIVVDYSVDGASFVPGKPRLWSDKQLFYTGPSNLDLAPDGKRFAVLALPDTPSGENASVHVTMLFNFFDELKRRMP